MATEQSPEAGYGSSEAERLAALNELVLAAHSIMWGRIDDYPLWQVPNQEDVSYWEKDYRRIKYLALPYLDRDNAPRFIPAELRLLEEGGGDSRGFYSLALAGVEIVWTDRESDVLVCDVGSQSIIDGWDSSETLTLAWSLNSGACVTYDPRECHVNGNGEIVPLPELIA